MENLRWIYLDQIVKLPDTNGFELTFKMKSERSDLKVIAQTAYASEEDKNKCFEAGCIGFISKPINKDLLLELIAVNVNNISE